MYFVQPDVRLNQLFFGLLTLLRMIGQFVLLLLCVQNVAFEIGADSFVPCCVVFSLKRIRIFVLKRRTLLRRSMLGLSSMSPSCVAV